ncbi:hypothetical protein V493_06189 [Pseudogymnoascus sp. VKM F-4281 (FW-2241)]|nr:hypothetical protein V493_06189 [Pseudogymnoascus sp. VKM F-4281 (FW-2241)]
MDGNWMELITAIEATLDKVIPRFIGILEETVEASSLVSQYLYLDAAAYYAHNEMEIGIWRVDHHEMKDEVYRREYAKLFKGSKPAEEWDDRLKLYGVGTKLMYSSRVPKGTKLRPQILQDLQDLIEKYGGKHIDSATTERTNSAAVDDTAVDGTSSAVIG